MSYDFSLIFLPNKYISIRICICGLSYIVIISGFDMQIKAIERIYLLGSDLIMGMIR